MMMLIPMFFMFIIALFVIPAILQWLWNITCPEIFKLPTITYWQAFRLIIIAGILFGGSHFNYQNSGGVGSMFHF